MQCVSSQLCPLLGKGGLSLVELFFFLEFNLFPPPKEILENEISLQKKSIFKGFVLLYVWAGSREELSPQLFESVALLSVIQ